MKKILVLFLVMILMTTTVLAQNYQKFDQIDLGQKYFQAVAISGDGDIMAAGIAGSDYLYTSFDAGTAWSQQTSLGTGNWIDVDMSDDGAVIFAIKTKTGTDRWHDDSYPTEAFLSANYGSTWTNITNDVNNAVTVARAVAVSGDGNKIGITSYSNGICTSNNYGSIWNCDTTISSWGLKNIYLDTDGSHGIAHLSDAILVSDDSGLTWNEKTINKTPIMPFNFLDVAMSGDGQTLVAVSHGNYPYISYDAGANWIDLAPLDDSWGAVDISADATKIILASGMNFNVKTGTYNTGLWNWQSESADTTINDVAMGTWAGLPSADGSHILASSSSVDYLNLYGPVFVNSEPVINFIVESTQGNEYSIFPANGIDLIRGAGDQVTYTPDITDVDGDAEVFWQILGEPASYSSSSFGGVYTAYAELLPPSNYTATLIVADLEYTNSATINFEVLPELPTIQSITPAIGVDLHQGEGATQEYVVSVYDPDGVFTPENTSTGVDDRYSWTLKNEDEFTNTYIVGNHPSVLIDADTMVQGNYSLQVAIIENNDLIDITQPLTFQILPPACTPNFECVAYEECVAPMTEANCVTVNDTNSCGEEYVGDYSEYITAICEYDFAVGAEPGSRGATGSAVAREASVTTTDTAESTTQSSGLVKLLNDFFNWLKSLLGGK